MWCKQCNLKTNETLCPVCGAETTEDIPVEVYWCESCKIPLVHLSTAADKGTCPICGGKTHYLRSLSINDLEGTQFKNLVNSITEISDSECSDILSGLVGIMPNEQDKIYCYYDSCENDCIFSTSINDLKTILADYYSADTKWSEMDTEDLVYWLERYHEEGSEIPCIFF